MGEVIPLRRRIVGERERGRRRKSELGGIRPATLTSIIREADRGKPARFADLCDRMMEDGHVRANYVTRLAAIGGARWEIEPTLTGIPERDAHSEAAAEFCEARLREIDEFEPAMVELLDAIGVSFAVQEMDWEWTGDWWTIGGFRFVHQRRFEFDDARNLRLVDFGDRRDPNGVPLSAFPGKFVVHQPREFGVDPGCGGVLRSVAWLWLFKRWAYEFWVHGAERFAWPMIMAFVSRDTGEAEREQLLTKLERLAQQGRMVTDEGAKIEFRESQYKDGGTWRDLTTTLNGEIGKAILGSVDQTEASEIGAWKAVESRKNTTVDSRMAMDERQFSATTRRDIMHWLCAYNSHRFGGIMPPVPRQRWRIAETRQELPAHLVATGSFTRNEVRASVGADPRPEDGDELVGGSLTIEDPAPLPVTD